MRSTASKPRLALLRGLNVGKAKRIAMPDLQQYRRLWQRLPRHAKERTGVSALFVAESGQVEEVR